MNTKLSAYLDEVFSNYEDLKPIRELKEELFHDLQERFSDLQKDGLDEKAAFERTIASIGEISELIGSIHASTTKLQQIVGIDFSKQNLQKSDLRAVQVHDGKFNYSNLQGSDFSHSDLTNASFKCSNLDNCNFDGSNLTHAKIQKSNLKGATFRNCQFNHTDFSSSELAGVCLDNLTFTGTIFHYTGLKETSFRNAVFQNCSFKTDVKKTIFDGAKMDKGTYAVLKGFKANLAHVTII
ncbi:pentapeptide repeat-containing protein [Paenibacillus chondroitinus]|uniref:Pentapeptide repeat-containing protein n=1 Tax=Paenibacillus chondroitinus TaxID=59842 RepID=A0ABU6DB69_9BACL|nr:MULTISPECIES: pentapeptide repeat-containing protein [Paenibacillus]MCY9656892.1 pentapeptide repeat-containing protein [Paenibacillus anseongense]MEB4794542.1 pentapeptide repeat-containing protein [Paenibacillus chondroitinus]